jgi:GDPmannose 4,6-dehydratase/GDP-4-dehydro-6-deoxy-D-mannose reductase
MRVFTNALITGITGSGGSYLADYIVAHHPEVAVHGIARWHSTSSHKNLEQSKERIAVHECDLNDMSATLRVLKDVRPDVIFHLAAYANVKASFITPLAVLDNNITSTANLLEAVRAAEIDPVIQICSTSEVYGAVDPKDVPIKEDCPIRPANPYAVSKTTQDMLGAVYHTSYGMKIITTRMFAYLNPRREDLFATAFARQVARIEQGLQKELTHGNLDSTRTLIDVRDAMESYWAAAALCDIGEVYNIGGTTVMKVGEFLDVLKKLATCEIPSRVDEALLRPTDVTLQIPDTTKFTEKTGWKPKYTFEDSVVYLLNYWREKAKREATSY